MLPTDRDSRSERPDFWEGKGHRRHEREDNVTNMVLCTSTVTGQVEFTWSRNVELTGKRSTVTVAVVAVGTPADGGGGGRVRRDRLPRLRETGPHLHLRGRAAGIRTRDLLTPSRTRAISALKPWPADSDEIPDQRLNLHSHPCPPVTVLDHGPPPLRGDSAGLGQGSGGQTKLGEPP